MKRMIRKTINLCALATALALPTVHPLSAQAAPSSPLADLLVAKGVISAEEAAKLRPSSMEHDLAELLASKGVISRAELAGLNATEGPEDSAAVAASPRTGPEPTTTHQPDPRTATFRAKEKGVESVTVFARFQAQWDALSTDYDNASSPGSENNLFLRRIYIGAQADFADNISGIINADLANNNEADGHLEKLLIQVGLSEHHNLEAGFKKVPISIEETTSSGRIPAIERSIATRYFTEQLNLGTRHTGLFFNGSYASGLYFSLGATNPEVNVVSTSSDSNRIALWGQLGWSGEAGDGGLNAGMGLGHIPGGRLLGRDDKVWNLYTTYAAGPFSLLAEVLGGTLEGARFDGSDAHPVALTLIPAYKVTDDLELVVRYSGIDTDGGVGADISSTFRRAPETGAAGYDDVSAYYLGGNWYIRGNALKLSAGYEWAKFEDNLTGSQGNADAEGFRTRLQLQF